MRTCPLLHPLALLAASGTVTVYAGVPQVVNLGYATYQGTLSPDTNITSFYGIRYASPPIGQLRFQAPRPPQTVKGTQPADVQPAACFTSDNGLSPTNPFAGLIKRATPIPPQDEDCLFLNIFVPGEINPRGQLPVVVWIHGGGYTRGTGATSNGGDLIHAAGGGLIAITVDYRLGVFGFLSGSVVKKRGALNAGLLDQRAALEWIRSHIHSFGGDPQKVTIWGQSAGAGSVLQHMIADGGSTRPSLFRAAILSSSFLPPQYHFNDPVPEGIFSDVVKQSGCSTSKDQFACLVSTPAETLQSINVKINTGAFFGTFTIIPVIDGELIRDRPTKLIQSGKLNGKLLFAMNNQFEGRNYVSRNFTTNITTTEYVQTLFPRISSSKAREIAEMYQGIGFNSVFEQASEVMGDSHFVCPTFTMLEHYPRASFKGEFAIPPANHGEDIMYYFPGDTGPPYKNQQFITSFSQSFLAIVKSLNPNDTPDPNNITPHWSTFSPGNFEMLFNRTESGEPVIKSFSTDPRLLSRCRVWQSIAPITSQ